MIVEILDIFGQSTVRENLTLGKERVDICVCLRHIGNRRFYE